MDNYLNDILSIINNNTPITKQLYGNNILLDFINNLYDEMFNYLKNYEISRKSIIRNSGILYTTYQEDTIDQNPLLQNNTYLIKYNKPFNKGGFSFIYELYNSEKIESGLLLKYIDPSKKNFIDIEFKTYIFHFCLQSYLKKNNTDNLKYICEILQYGKILINNTNEYSYYCIMKNCGKNLNKLNEKYKYNKTYNEDRITNDIKKLIYIFIECCNSVNILHKIGYIHNDIKEANFLFYENNKDEIQIKIIDFGNIKKEGTIIYKKKFPYTPGYVYPLIFKKNNDYFEMNINFDIFSLGITFLNILLTYFDLKSYIHYTNIYSNKKYNSQKYYQLFNDKNEIDLLIIKLEENIKNTVNKNIVNKNIVNKNTVNKNIIKLINKILLIIKKIISNPLNYNIDKLIEDLNNIL
jgi:hypothetical protein